MRYVFGKSAEIQRKHLWSIMGKRVDNGNGGTTVK